MSGKQGTCETCRFFVKTGRNFGRDQGLCHRRAPTCNGFPPVDGINWCGEYESKQSTERSSTDACGSAKVRSGW